MGRVLVLLAVVACGQPSRVMVEDTPPAAVARVQPRVDAGVASRGFAKARSTAAGGGESPGCVDDAHPYDEAALRTHLDYLASKQLDGRVPGTKGDRAARAYVAERFRCLGLMPG